MKHSISIIALALTFYNAFAQYDLTGFATNNSNSSAIANDGGNLFYSSNFTNDLAALHTVDLNNATGPDTIIFPVTIAGEIIPSTGINASNDTLTIEIAVGYWGNTNNTANPSTSNTDFTIKNRFASYEYTNQSRSSGGSSKLYDEFKFIEGETDTVMIIVTAGTFVLDNMYIRSTNATVISNAGDGLFDENGATISNPVVGGELSIQLPNDISSASVALLSMEGKVIETKEVTTANNSFDVSKLKGGMYFLKDLSSASVKKVIIK